MERKFYAEHTVVTAGVASTMSDDSFNVFVKKSLERHFSGDWGNVYQEDKQTSDRGLSDGYGMMMGVYEAGGMPVIWIITESDRSTTTVLFPSEY